MPTAQFTARFEGRCAANSCIKGGRISIGDAITWDRKRKGSTMHVECMKSYSNDSFVQSNVKPESEYVPFDLESSKVFDDEQLIKQLEDSMNLIKDKSEEKAKRILEKSEPLINENVSTETDLAKAIADAISKYQKPVEAGINEKLVIELIKKHSLAPTVTEIFLRDPVTLDVKDLGKQHQMFGTLLTVLTAKDSNGYSLNVWLTGPAGSGKTTAARECARALDKQFYFTGAMDNQYGLSGFIDAGGKVVRTPFRECYETGGVFLWDEVDACSPNALLWANAALANHHCAFPDKIVERHKDCIVIAAANTWGLGATNDYVGRMKLDAAFIDRFVQISWDIDEALESATCGNEGWSRIVQKVRKNVKAKGMKVVVSPRSSYYGAALLAAGLSLDHVTKMTLRKAMTDDQWESVKA